MYLIITSPHIFNIFKSVSVRTWGGWSTPGVFAPSDGDNVCLRRRPLVGWSTFKERIVAMCMERSWSGSTCAGWCVCFEYKSKFRTFEHTTTCTYSKNRKQVFQGRRYAKHVFNILKIRIVFLCDYENSTPSSQHFLNVWFDLLIRRIRSWCDKEYLRCEEKCVWCFEERERERERE